MTEEELEELDDAQFLKTVADYIVCLYAMLVEQDVVALEPGVVVEKTVVVRRIREIGYRLESLEK